MLDRLYTEDVRNLPNVQWAGYWYKMGDPIMQMEIDPLTYITSDPNGMLNQEYGYIIGHCGYCDRELFELSSFNTCRVMDLSAATSPKMKKWIETNHIELVNFKEVKF